MTVPSQHSDLLSFCDIMLSYEAEVLLENEGKGDVCTKK